MKLQPSFGFIANSNTLIVKPEYVETFENFFIEAEVSFKLRFNHFTLDLEPWQKTKLQEKFPTIGEVKVISTCNKLQPELGWIDVHIDRQSPLDNPFVSEEADDQINVVNAYHDWLESVFEETASPKDWGLAIAPSYKYPTPDEVRAEFNRIRNLVKSGHNIRLVYQSKTSTAEVLRHLLQ